MLRLAAFLICSAASVPTMAGQPWPSTADLEAIPPTSGGLAVAAKKASASRCRTPSCKAIITIDRLLVIQRERQDEDYGSAGTVYEGNKPRVAKRRIDQLLFQYRNLFQPVCTAAGHLLSRVHLDPDTDELFVSTTLLIVAVDMDLRDHGRCAADLVSMLPHDPENDRIRINSRDLCMSDYVGRRRPPAACEALANGAIDRGY